MALNEEQIVETVLQQRLKLISFIRSIVCDFHVAEDMFQKVCLLALQSKDKFRDSSYLIKWVWVVSRNESLKYLREKKKQHIMLDGQILELIQTESEKSSFLDDPDTRIILENCIAQLSEPVKKLLEKRYKQDLTGARLAQALNRNVKSIYVAITRAHKALYDCMQKKIKPVKD